MANPYHDKIGRFTFSGGIGAHGDPNRPTTTHSKTGVEPTDRALRTTMGLPAKPQLTAEQVQAGYAKMAEQFKHGTSAEEKEIAAGYAKMVEQTGRASRRRSRSKLR